MSDKLLRSELIKLAHSNPELRPHLLPIIKGAAEEEAPKDEEKKEETKEEKLAALRAAAKKTATERMVGKMLGELWTTAEGAVSLKLVMRSGTAPLLFKKLLMAYGRRALNISHDDKSLTITEQKGPEVVVAPGESV